MTTEPRDFATLEQRAADRLRALPNARAPRQLLPNVMAAVGAVRALPWYSRPWLTWPVMLQALSIVVLAAAGAGVWSLWTHAESVTAVQQFRQATAAIRVLWDVLIGPIAMFVLAVALLVSLACVAAWTAVRHVALGGASSR